MTTIRALTEKEINELREKIVFDESINNYYSPKNGKPVKDAWLFTYIKKRKFKNELWKKCKTYKYYDYEVYASNLGRIKVIKNKKEIICVLCEEIAPEPKINRSLFKSLIKQGERHIGYLKAKIPGNKKCLGPYVYQMVADAWLAEEYKSGMQVHHITKDGYDNRPENLIIVSKEDHHNIHHKNGRYYRGNKKDDYKPL